MNPWNETLGNFELASPELLAQRALQSRTDTKFVVAAAYLSHLFAGLEAHYALLGPAATYETLYFDTPGLDCFHDHRRGRRVRHKMRMRRYVERGLSVLEVKSRRSGALTEKTRRERQGGDELSAEEVVFVRCQTGIAEPLIPAVWTNYRRMTFVGVRSSERVTVDTDLWFAGDTTAARLGGQVIIEVKQASLTRETPIMRALRGLRIHSRSASKYCAAIALTRPDIVSGRLLPGLRALVEVRS